MIELAGGYFDGRRIETDYAADDYPLEICAAEPAEPVRIQEADPRELSPCPTVVYRKTRRRTADGAVVYAWLRRTV